MAAKGAQAKQEVTSKILSAFEGAFVYDKEIRIPMTEDGVEVQIKVTLTCAKTNVEAGGDTALPNAAGAVSAAPIKSNGAVLPRPGTAAEAMQPSEEEKKSVQDMLKSLGL